MSDIHHAPTPRAIGHIGLTVRDLNAATRWYNQVLGFRLISPPAGIEANIGPFGENSADIFGPLRPLAFFRTNNKPQQKTVTGPREHTKMPRSSTRTCSADPDIMQSLRRKETD